MVDADRRDPERRGHRQSRSAAAVACASRSSTTPPARSPAWSTSTRTARSSVQKARVVAVAGNSIESAEAAPQLGLVEVPGRPRQLHRARSAGTTCGTSRGRFTAMFERPVHMYRGTTMAGIVRDEARNDPIPRLRRRLRIRDVVAGAALHGRVPRSRRLGARLSPAALDAYENMAGMWIVGEDMPQETNRVTLDPTEKDKAGMPVANVHYDDHPERRRDARACLASRPGDVPGRRARRKRCQRRPIPQRTISAPAE